MTDTYVLAIDVGTSSTRAILFDSRAAVVDDCVAQRANELRTSPDGGAVFEADALFASTVSVIDQVLHSAGPRRSHIEAVAIDTFVGNVLGVDASGRPITPVYTYADTRNALQTNQLRTQLGAQAAKEAHDRTGCIIHTSYLPARFLWLHETKPELHAQADRWVSIGEYIAFRLFGTWGVSYSVAAWSGLLNRRDLRWDQTWLSQLPVDEEQLSPLCDLSQPFCGLQAEWYQRWPDLGQIPWLPAIGDGAAANIGSGCDSPERVALTVGSTGAMRVVTTPDIAEMPAGLWLYRVDAARGLLGGATTEGGNVYSWLYETLALPSEDELESRLQQSEPFSHGVTVLPFFAGERAPGWHEDARAVFCGISLHTSPLDLVQASLEAIAMRFALIYRRIAPYLPATESRIIASGGAILSSPAWLQMTANILAQPILTLAEKETTARGIALLTLEHLGHVARPSDLAAKTGASYEPQPQYRDVCAEALQRQVELYTRIYESAVYVAEGDS